MRSLHVVAAAAIALGAVGCGSDEASGPFDPLPVTGDFTVGLGAPVHVARDKYGVAHISGKTAADVGFVQGYVMAHDRLPQMDILRRYGAGTLSELFGALSPNVIDGDLEMRMHRMKPLAQATWDMLQASTDPIDQEVVQVLQRFSDGVNRYADDLRANKWDLDPDVLASFDPTRFTAWDPVDSLVLGRFQAFSLSWSTSQELDLTELYQKLTQTYTNATASNPAAYARRGIVHDLMMFQGVATTSTIDGFPNVGTDTGSRSDGGVRPRQPSARAAPATAALGQRPTVPQELFDQARTTFARGIHTGPFGALGPHAFMHPLAGSNNWAVGPALAGEGTTLLASDQHLQLPNPSIFYPTHIIIADDNLDELGITFPGIPGVILGTNGHVAWAATVSEHDVNDAYLEQITPCAGGSCVTFNGQQVPIQGFDEEIKVGALGTITSTQMAHYELVPHHGPIIPTIANHQVVPRTGASAISVKYTGYEPTFEIRALWNLGHAQNVHDGFRALADFSYGSQNWTMIDDSASIGWTTEAVVPTRSPAAYTWNLATNPTGNAPFFVLPGDGTAEWDGRMSARYVPHAIDPANGYLATANADPVGATNDNDPLDQPIVDGRPLYAGWTYDAGLRVERIATRIEQTFSANGTVTLADLASIQHDTRSNAGAKMIAPILAALAHVTNPAGAPNDVATFVAGLSATDKTRLATAQTLLAAWTQATPAALDAKSTDSAATALFNAFMHYFLNRAFLDEFSAAGFGMTRLDEQALLRIAYAMLSTPGSFVPSPSTGEPLLCDNFGTAGPDDSCTKVILQSTIDAMSYLAGSNAFGTTDTDQWRWGKLHQLTITPLFPNTALDLGPFAKAGDNYAVNRSDMGWYDLDFSQFADGPAQRMLCEAHAGEGITVKWQLPGGTIFDSRSPHYRDLLDNYYLPETHFDAPFKTAEIVAAGEDRWIFH